MPIRLNKYGKRGTEFYSIIDGAFASMILLLSSVNEGIEASFVGAFEDNKVSKILGLPIHVKPIGIIALGYPTEKPLLLLESWVDRLREEKKDLPQLM